MSKHLTPANPAAQASFNGEWTVEYMGRVHKAASMTELRKIRQGFAIPEEIEVTLEIKRNGATWVSGWAHRMRDVPH